MRSTGGDFETLRTLVTDDYRQEDHRSMGAEPIVGRDAFVAILAQTTDMAQDVRLAVDLIAVAGERSRPPPGSGRPTRR